MPQSFSRRRFLELTAGVTAGLAAASMVGPFSAVGHAADKSRKILATCRDGMLRHTGEPCCWTALKRIGAEGVEVMITETLALPAMYHPTKKYSLASAVEIDAFRADAAAAGMKITGFLMSNKFEARPDVEIDWCKRAAEAAKALGVPAIRIDVVAQKLKRPEFLALAIETLKKMMAATEATGVPFGIENHGHTTNDPEFLDPLFEQVGSKRLGLTLDIGNFYWFGHPLSKVYTLCEKYATRTFHTHCKSINYPADERETQRKTGLRYGELCCPIDRGDIDYGRVAQILTKVGYANDLCVEDESLGKFKGQGAEVLSKEIELLKRVQQ